MPNRLFRDGLRDSERVATLGDFGERVFVRLIIAADDAGRLDGRAESLRSAAFPGHPRFSAARVSRAVDTIVAAGLATVWSFDDKPVLQIRRWQRASNSLFSRFPAADGSFRIAWLKLETRDGEREFVSSSISGADAIPSPPRADGMPMGSTSRVDGVPTGSVWDGHGTSVTSPKTKTKTKSVSLAAAPTKPVRGRAREEKPRQSNPLFDALASVDGRTDVAQLTRQAAGAVGAALSSIREVVGDALTVAEIEARASRYRSLHPTWNLTSSALAKHWASLGVRESAPVRSALEPEARDWVKAFLATRDGWRAAPDGAGVIRNSDGEIVTWASLPATVRAELAALVA